MLEDVSPEIQMMPLILCLTHFTLYNYIKRATYCITNAYHKLNVGHATYCFSFKVNAIFVTCI